MTKDISKQLADFLDNFTFELKKLIVSLDKFVVEKNNEVGALKKQIKELGEVKDYDDGNNN